MILLAALALFATATSGREEPVAVVPGADAAREWRLRALARDPRGVRLDGGSWRERVLGLEALARGLAAAAPPDPALARAVALACADPHPNVRAAALELAAQERLAVDVPRLDPLARDPWPEAHAAYLRWLARALPEGAARELARRARAGESEARAELLAAGPPAADGQLEVLAAGPVGEEELALLRGGGVAPELGARLAELAEGDPATRAFAELLVLAAGSPPDPDALLAAGHEPHPLALDGMAELPELTARLALADPAAGRDLARGLLDLAAREVLRDGDDAYPSGLVAAAVAALEADELAVQLAACPPLVVELALEELALRSQRPAPGALAPWLAPELPDSLRLHVLSVLGASLDGPTGARAGELLVAQLADPVLGPTAFRELAEAGDPTPWLPALHAAWRRLPADQRTARLRDLPRDRAPGPFEPDLLAALREDRLEPSALELCARFPAGVRALQVSVVQQLVLRGASPTREEDMRLRATIQARALARDERVVTDLEHIAGALVALGEEEAVRAKYALAGLAELPGADLTPWLAPDLPRRLRIEAGIGLLARGRHPAAAEVLIEGYDGCDRLLRARILAVLAAEPAARTFLAALLEGELSFEVELEERRQALEALGRLGADADLARFAREPRAFELCGSWIEVVGRRARAGSAAAREALEAGIRPLEAAGEEALARVDEELAVARARLGGPWLDAALRVVAGLGAGEEERLLARRRGDALAAVEFQFDHELALVELLAAEGRHGEVLAALGALERLGADLALALARRLRGEARLELARRAWIALPGEREGEELSALRVAVLMELLGAAEESGDWVLFALACERLLDPRGLGPAVQRHLVAALGRPDPRAGVDPRARLEAGRLQALALEALEGGDGERARSLAHEASGRLGHSRAARAAQARLEASIDG